MVWCGVSTLTGTRASQPALCTVLYTVQYTVLNIAARLSALAVRRDEYTHKYRDCLSYEFEDHSAQQLSKLINLMGPKIFKKLRFP